MDASGEYVASSGLTSSGLTSSVCKKTKKIQNVVLEIQHSLIRWLEHVFSGRDHECTSKQLLDGTAPRRRKQGWPRTTWRRNVIGKLQEMGLTWHEAQLAAKYRYR